MPGIPGSAAELAAIHDAFAVPIVYTGAGLAGATIDAVPIRREGPVFMDEVQNVRQRGYELRSAALSGTPARGDTLTDGGSAFRVIDAVERDDVDGWHVFVEAA